MGRSTARPTLRPAGVSLGLFDSSSRTSQRRVDTPPTLRRRLATMVEPTASAQHAPPPFATLRLPHHPSHLPDSSPAQAPSFYKRPLPATCTAFDSTEGKALFKRAMAEATWRTTSLSHSLSS